MSLFFFVSVIMSNKYCQKNKKKLQKEAHEWHQNLSKEETKDKKGPWNISKFFWRKIKKGANIIMKLIKSFLWKKRLA